MTTHARPWRLLVQMKDGSESFGTAQQDGTPHHAHTTISADFDEIVVSDWLHVENMAPGVWWMRVGDAVLWVRHTKDGPVVSLTEGTADPETGIIAGGRETSKQIRKPKRKR